MFVFFFSQLALPMGNEFRCIERFRLEIEAFSCLLANGINGMNIQINKRKNKPLRKLFILVGVSTPGGPWTDE
jgi:hypothetical protein